MGAVTATDVPTGVVVDVVAGDSMTTVLDWNQDRQFILAESEQGSVAVSLAGLLSALLVAVGAYGVWRAR